MRQVPLFFSGNQNDAFHAIAGIVFGSFVTGADVGVVYEASRYVAVRLCPGARPSRDAGWKPPVAGERSYVAFAEAKATRAVLMTVYVPTHAHRVQEGEPVRADVGEDGSLGEAAQRLDDAHFFSCVRLKRLVTNPSAFPGSHPSTAPRAQLLVVVEPGKPPVTRKGSQVPLLWRSFAPSAGPRVGRRIVAAIRCGGLKFELLVCSSASLLVLVNLGECRKLDDWSRDG